MSNRLLMALLLGLLSTVSAYAQSIGARFSTEKQYYWVGEPLFVALTVSNATNEPIWLDFKGTDFPWPCYDFDLEVPGSELPREGGCGGVAASCARGFREVRPGKSITIRRLVNREFRMQRPGPYAIHAHVIISVHSQDLFDSRKISQLDVSDSVSVRVRGSTEKQLKAAFRSYVEALNSADDMTRSEAVQAITELAPPFLEDALIELTKTNYAYSAIAALRKVNTPKTVAALAQIATGSDDPTLRIEAIRNLGRTNDTAYLPTLFQLMESGDTESQKVAAEAAGTLGGVATIQRLSTFVSSADVETRIAGANGLGLTHARGAVPILMEQLLDSDSNVRQAAVNNLWLLTHRAALDGNEWADISTMESAAGVHQRWVRWWASHGTTCEIHGMTDCSSPQPLD